MVSTNTNRKRPPAKPLDATLKAVESVTPASELEEMRISDEDAETIKTSERVIERLHEQLGRAREHALMVETQVLNAINKARGDWQTVVTTIGKKNGLKNIGVPDVQYNYDSTTQTYKRTR